MKGLEKHSDDGIFLVVKHGCICRESRTPREGFTPIEVMNIRTGNATTKYIERYKRIIATIKKIEWYDREFEDTRFMGWKLVLDDGDGTVCTLDLPFESRVGSRFMKLAENIDYADPVEFSAWRGPDDKTAFSVKQHGQNIPQKYTRDDPGDCPPPVQGFNKKWNFDAQKEFLHERMVNVVIPRVQAINASNGHHETVQGEGASTEGATNGNEILASIQTDLKNYAAEQSVTVTDAIEKFFGTRSWSQVENLAPATLAAKAKELADAVIPF